HVIEHVVKAGAADQPHAPCCVDHSSHAIDPRLMLRTPPPGARDVEQGACWRNHGNVVEDHYMLGWQVARVVHPPGDDIVLGASTNSGNGQRVERVARDAPPRGCAGPAKSGGSSRV